MVLMYIFVFFVWKEDHGFLFYFVYFFFKGERSSWFFFLVLQCFGKLDNGFEFGGGGGARRPRF